MDELEIKLTFEESWEEEEKKEEDEDIGVGVEKNKSSKSICFMKRRSKKVSRCASRDESS